MADDWGAKAASARYVKAGPPVQSLTTAQKGQRPGGEAIAAERQVMRQSRACTAAMNGPIDTGLAR